MHDFVREHIVRGTWKKKPRPVLLNSWEASYFDINERKLLNLAKEGSELGIELFVMDDGWFGNRNDDTSSLGDWAVNKKKLPNGIKGVAEGVKKYGMDVLTKRFPNILFEGCSAGGNRFDLGILCYFPQIWGRDNTDALCRVDMQNAYSYGYPLSTFGAHVSGCPNHQTLRVTPLESRFNVACFGVLGYEINVCDLKNNQKEAIDA